MFDERDALGDTPFEQMFERKRLSALPWT